MERNRNSKEDIKLLPSIIIDGETISLKDTLYFARIHPTLAMFEVEEIKVRAITPEWFSAYNKKQAFLFNNSSINTKVFTDRKKAVEVVKEAEKTQKIPVSEETDYEEY